MKAAQKRRLNPLEHERRIVDSVDEEQPELSFDMDELDDTILMAQRSQQPDRRAAGCRRLRGVHRHLERGASSSPPMPGR